MYNMLEIGAKLKELRKINKLSANEACELMAKYNYPICIKTLYKWEQGIVTPDIISLKTLCHIYNTSIEELFVNNNSKFVTVGSFEHKFIQMIRANNNFKKALILIVKNEIGEN